MKYIVYCTTNVVNNKIYIGVHKTNPDKFDGYIGCGVYITQPSSYEKAKTAFLCAVKKYGPDKFKRKTLAIFNTEKEALALEEELVNENFLQRNDVYNIVLGGICGCPEFYKIKVYQYDLSGKYITEYNSYADAAEKLNCDYTLISYAVRKKAKAKNSYWCTDKFEILDLKDYNIGENQQIKVFCYLKTGEFYKEYVNQTQAAKDLNISTTSVKNSRLFGTLVKKQYYFCTVKADSFDKARLEYVKNRPVFKYDGLTGEFISEYESQIEAELCNPNSNISKSIRLKTLDKNNFIWGVERLKNIKNSEKNKKRKVGKFDLSGNLIQEYDSATKAANENGTSVWKVLSGINQTHKKHIYKYLS